MDRYKDQVSPELTELRTVLSRARTAYDTIKNTKRHHPVDEHIKMLGDLAMVIAYLEQYQGKRSRWRREA